GWYSQVVTGPFYQKVFAPGGLVLNIEQYGDASVAPNATTTDTSDQANGSEDEPEDGSEEPSIWDSLWSRQFNGTITNSLNSFTGTSVNYSTAMSYNVNTSLDLSVSTSANYRFIGGTDITQYSAGYSMYTICGDGGISLGTEGSFSTIGQSFFTPGTLILGSRPTTGGKFAAQTVATLATTSKLAKFASLAAKLTALVDEVGTKFFKGYPQSALDLPAAITARLAAPAATTAAALMTKAVVGNYKKITRHELETSSAVEPTIKIEPHAIILSVGTYKIEIDEIEGITLSGKDCVVRLNSIDGIYAKSNRISLVSSSNIEDNDGNNFGEMPTTSRTSEIIIGPTEINANGSLKVDGKTIVIGQTTVEGLFIATDARFGG
ncbi:hypothetical protein, partial [Inquilinus sp. CA228]|uniref:hypothetical protein n=1 Tax=Inquilinus sp. CA228 TaxID=3455609 RepID=UPI003F8D009A